jgi:hypothetical protein
VALTVADGHGSSKFAEKGAQLAVDVTLQALLQFAENLGESVQQLSAVQAYAVHPLRTQLVREWADQVRAEAGQDVRLVDFGSTLLFALATESFLLIGQLGDGDILLVDDSAVHIPLPPDPLAFADETPSLCQKEAWMAIRVRVMPVPKPGSLLIISTDGYSKSYANDTVFQQIGPDYLQMIQTEGLPALKPHLEGFLKEVTSRGSGDDIALGMLYWPSSIEHPDKQQTAQPIEEVQDENKGTDQG